MVMDICFAFKTNSACFLILCVSFIINKCSLAQKNIKYVSLPTHQSGYLVPVVLNKSCPKSPPEEGL